MTDYKNLKLIAEAGHQHAAEGGAQAHNGANGDIRTGGGGDHQGHADGQDCHLAAAVEDVDQTAVEHAVGHGDLKEVVEAVPNGYIVDHIDAQHQNHTKDRQKQPFLGQFFQVTHRLNLPQWRP